MIRRLAFGITYAAIIGGLAACASQQSQQIAETPPPASPIAVADRITRAIYDDRPSAVTTDFNDALRRQVHREDVAAISHRMHRLGDYHGLVAQDVNPDTGRYVFAADFTRGMMQIRLRLDRYGKVAAYRVK